jgi:hypothetical protein
MVGGINPCQVEQSQNQDEHPGAQARIIEHRVYCLQKVQHEFIDSI